MPSARASPASPSILATTGRPGRLDRHRLGEPVRDGLAHRGDNAPGGAVTRVDDHRPAGAGQGRKVG